MLTFEWDLLTRIAKTGSIKEVLDWGIRSEDFGITQARAVFDFIHHIYMDRSSAGSVLGDDSMEKFYPDFAHSGDDSVTTDFLCKMVRMGYQQREGKALVEKYSELTETDVGEALGLLVTESRRLLEIGTSKNSDLGMGEGMRRLVLTYEQKKLGLAKPKFLWPWPVMNEATGGVSDEDYIVFYGRPKQMKSWGLAYVAAWALNQDLRVVVYTKEMTPDSMRARIAVAALALSYSLFRQGKLPPDQESLLIDYKDFWATPQTRGSLIVLDAADLDAGADSVGWLEAKIEKHHGDVVFIDGLHLMSDGSKKEQADHQRVRNISKQVRFLGLRKRIPVIATVHATRKAAGHSEGNLDEIAYSDGIGQDATIAIRTIRERHQKTIAMILAGSREFELHGFRIHREVAENFTQHSVMAEDEVIEATQRENEGKPPKKNGSKPRKEKESNPLTDGLGLSPDAEALVAAHWKHLGVTRN